MLLRAATGSHIQGSVSVYMISTGIQQDRGEKKHYKNQEDDDTIDMAYKANIRICDWIKEVCHFLIQQ